MFSCTAGAPGSIQSTRSDAVGILRIAPADVIGGPRLRGIRRATIGVKPGVDFNAAFLRLPNKETPGVIAG